MEGGGQMRGSSWVLPGLLALGLWYAQFSQVQPMHCAASILPSGVNEIFSSRLRGFTLTAKSKYLKL